MLGFVGGVAWAGVDANTATSASVSVSASVSKRRGTIAVVARLATTNHHRSFERRAAALAWLLPLPLLLLQRVPPRPRPLLTAIHAAAAAPAAQRRPRPRPRLPDRLLVSPLRALARRPARGLWTLDLSLVTWCDAMGVGVLASANVSATDPQGEDGVAQREDAGSGWM